jgi:putative oxidoreductase
MKKHLPKVTRYLLGLIFFVFGGAGLLNLLPPPPDMPAKLQAFMNGMMATGYFMPFLKLTETISGFCLLAGIAPALILVVLAPVTLNIIFVHAFLTPGLQNLVLPVVILTLHLITAKQYWKVYRPLFNRYK